VGYTTTNEDLYCKHAKANESTKDSKANQSAKDSTTNGDVYCTNTKAYIWRRWMGCSSTIDYKAMRSGFLYSAMHWSV